MKIEFNNPDRATSISVDDDSPANEIAIKAKYDGVEAWHVFTNLEDLDDFIEAAKTMRSRLAKRLGEAPKTR